VKVDAEEYGTYIDKFSDLTGVEVRTIKMESSGGSMIELLYYYNYPDADTSRLPLKYKINQVGISHVALTIDSFVALQKEFENGELDFVCPPLQPPGANVLVAFARDPDGNLLELVEELK